MDDSIKTDIEVIKVKIEGLSDQMNRFISHLESEQRVTNNISKRLDLVENSIKWMQEANAKKENSNKWRVETIISLITLAATVVHILFSK